MNRNEEYKALVEELDNTPLKLDFTLERAQLRLREQKRRSKTRRAILSPFGFIAAVFAVFVLLVNISPAFACTVGRIPLLHDLAKYVAFFPSLSAAVDNNYYQEIGQEQTVNGITAGIEYIIVDQKQLTIFYTLDSNVYEAMNAMPEISDSNSEKPVGVCVAWNGDSVVNGDLRKVTVDFASGTMPVALKLKLSVSEAESASATSASAPSDEKNQQDEEPIKEPAYIAEFNFDLTFNPNYLDKAERYTPEDSFVIDGQTLTLVSAEIYPTSMRLTFDGAQSNTAWLKNIDFYVENDRGELFDGINNGISAYGSSDSPMTPTYIIESPFFSDSKNLTLYITGARWLDKSIDRVHIDLASKKADYLAKGLAFEMAEKTENGWALVFSEQMSSGDTSSQLWDWNYYDSQGKSYELNGISTQSDGYFDNDRKTSVSLQRKNTERIELENYPYDEVWLCPAFTDRSSLDEPLSIKIK